MILLKMERMLNRKTFKKLAVFSHSTANKSYEAKK